MGKKIMIVILLIVLVFLASLNSCVTINSSSTSPSVSGKIIFKMFSDKALYSMNLDGSAKFDLSSITKSDYPANLNNSSKWSPDGSRIAFIFLGALCVMDVDGSSRIQLAGRASLHEFFWSPDGSKIVFVIYYADSANPGFVTGLDIALADTNGKNTKQLTYTADCSNPSWSPDGRQIFFSVSSKRGEKYAGRWKMDTDGSNQTQLHSPLTIIDYAGILVKPNFSPNGSRIAYVKRTSPNNCNVVITNMEGYNIAQFNLTDTNMIYSITWSPNSHHIAFQRMYNETVEWGITVVDIDDPKPREFVRASARQGKMNTKPFWSPDSNYIVYLCATQGDNGFEVWTVNSDGKNRVLLGTCEGETNDYDIWFK